jgi:murein peptide amidase A
VSSRATPARREDPPAPRLRERSQRGTIPFEPERYGRSVQGRPLEVWLPTEPPRLLVAAGIHGEEPESTVLLSTVLRSLAGGELAAAVVLCANPDGIARGTRGNARGVELNRNFDAADWSPEAPRHHLTRSDPQDVILSPGERPFSEPESAALAQLIERLAPAAVVTLHAPLGCVIDAERSPLARALSAEAELPLVDAVPSPTPGNLESWCRERLGAAAVTFELPVISKDEALVRYAGLVARLVSGRIASP